MISENEYLEIAQNVYTEWGKGSKTLAANLIRDFIIDRIKEIRDIEPKQRVKWLILNDETIDETIINIDNVNLVQMDKKHFLLIFSLISGVNLEVKYKTLEKLEENYKIFQNLVLTK